MILCLWLRPKGCAPCVDKADRLARVLEIGFAHSVPKFARYHLVRAAVREPFYEI